MFWARSKAVSSSSSSDSYPWTGAGCYLVKPAPGPRQDIPVLLWLFTFSSRIYTYWFLSLHKGLLGFSQHLKVLALLATVSCNEAKQNCISPLVILVFCYPDALEPYWCVENYEVRKILISFKDNCFHRKGIFQEQLNRSVLQGGGAEQESREDAVPCPALVC